MIHGKGRLLIVSMCGEKETDTNTQKMFQSKVNERWEWKKVKKKISLSLSVWVVRRKMSHGKIQGTQAEEKS